MFPFRETSSGILVKIDPHLLGSNWTPQAHFDLVEIDRDFGFTIGTDLVGLAIEVDGVAAGRAARNNQSDDLGFLFGLHFRHFPFLLKLLKSHALKYNTTRLKNQEKNQKSDNLCLKFLSHCTILLNV